MENEYISEEFDEWQQIPSPNSIDKAQWINENNTPIIKEDFFTVPSVFPPTNHEDLSITTSQEPLYSISLSSSSSSLPEDDLNGSEVESDGVKSDQVGKWRRMIVGAWRFRLVKATSEMKSYAVCRIKLWSSVFAATGVLSAVVISLWCMRVQRWRKRVQMERVQHLMLLVKEREQKINQLLLQIAHMNEMLLTRRRVPVLRVS